MSHQERCILKFFILHGRGIKNAKSFEEIKSYFNGLKEPEIIDAIDELIEKKFVSETADHHFYLSSPLDRQGHDFHRGAGEIRCPGLGYLDGEIVPGSA